MSDFSGIKIAFALTGSFCTFSDTIDVMQKLVDLGAEIIPIMSENAFSIDTRFGSAKMFREQITRICKREIIRTIDGAEPIGPQKMADVLVIAPCTGNTLAKLAYSITDTSVTTAFPIRAYKKENQNSPLNIHRVSPDYELRFFQAPPCRFPR